VVLTQAGTQNTPVVVTDDSLRGPELQPAVRARLDAVPGYLVVSDRCARSTPRPPCGSLAPEDGAILVSAALRLSPRQPVAKVQLARDRC